MKQRLSLFFSLALAYLAALVGSVFTVGAIPTWYATLVKPALNPPNWVFGPVWTVLYACMAVAAWRVYVAKGRRVSPLLVVYAVHLAVNALWSVVFFGLHQPQNALGVIVVLWGLVVYLAVRFYSVDKAAGILFVPYVLWVSFATYLNLVVVLLN